MNKYIILLIILLIAIIFYFTYKHDKKNIENFSKINSSVVTFLTNNYLTVNNEGGIEVQNRSGKKIGLNINKGVVSMGNNFTLDPSNNNLKCGNFDIDKTGRVKSKTDDNLIVDPSGNITIGDFIYEKSGNLKKKDNSIQYDPSGNVIIDDYNFEKTGKISKRDKSFEIDPSGNLNFGDFTIEKTGKINKRDSSLLIDPSGNVNLKDIIYSANGKLSKKDNSFEIDPSGNVSIGDFSIDIKNKNLKKKDGSFEDSNDKFKCGDNYETDKSSSNKNIKFNNISFTLNNGIYTRNDNKYIIYNNNVIYNTPQIILEKPYTNSNYDMNDAWYFPINIASIRFYDYNGNVIPPEKYTVSIVNIANGQFDQNGATDILRYYDSTKNKNSSYGGPKVDSYSLYWNKTIGFTGTTPTISTGGNNTYLNRSHDFVGHGQTYGLIPSNYSYGYYLDTTTRAVKTNPPAQRYVFTFNVPVFIKFIEIENRKNIFTEWYMINGSWTYLPSYNRTINTKINLFTSTQRDINATTLDRTTLLYSIDCKPSSSVTTSLPANQGDENISQQSQGTIKKYPGTAAYYSGTIPTGFNNHIVRYYVQ